jgi:AcrR family transcriptional regulator
MANPERAADHPSGKPARAPRGTLNRQLIVERAVQVLDEEGVDSITVRQLARRLGVRPMALYTYFKSKDEILTAIYDHVVSQLDLPEVEGAGIDAIRQIMRAYFRLLVEHAALVRMATGNDMSSDGDLRISEVVYTVLLNAGISRRDSVGITASLVRFTLGCATLYGTRRAWDQDRDYWPRVKNSLAELPGERYPVLRSFGEDLPEFTQEQVFEFGLDAILDNFLR